MAKKKQEGADQNFVLGLVVVIALLVIVTLGISWNTNIKVGKLTGGAVMDTGEQDTAPTQDNNKPEQQAVPTVEVEIDDDAMKGDDDAPITIIEFSDFECPYCGRFYAETLSQLEQEYIETGKAKLVYRDFPLSFHPNAQKAAEAAECAGEQGSYWEMHDMIFENQQAISVDDLKGYAGDLGLGQDEFDSCLDNGDMAQEVQDDFNAGRAAGVSGTPTFFINGVKLVGAQPFAQFKAVIDAELAK